ncbi:putative ATP-dependent RNA helicase [uncultured archaeon]|nr:putative ATP-dependent RNA helicase [uncultured archaeon]
MVKIEFFDTQGISSKIGRSNFEPFEFHSLNHLANTIRLKGKQMDLLAVSDLKDKITPYPHQIDNALKFLNDVDGRLLIADEVGLGKTITAGLIMKELILRFGIRKILILCPASLTEQWQDELEAKFLESFEINKSVHFWNKDKLITSIDTAKLPKHVKEIRKINWDLLVIDEAHRLKNTKTVAYQSLASVPAKYKLFLTATPIQNTLLELHAIIDAMEPNYLGTLSEFKFKYFGDKEGLKLSDQEGLKRALEGALVRSTRKSTGLSFTQRNVNTVHLIPSAIERKFEDIVIAFISQVATDIHESNSKNVESKNYSAGTRTLMLMTLLRMLQGSKRAFEHTFQKFLKNNPPLTSEEALRANQILEICGKVENRKLDELTKLVKKIQKKTLIFTSFVETQEEIVKSLQSEGFKVEKFNGSMNSTEKNDAVRRFKTQSDILVCTESGSEGRNMQFCHNLVNYDLPWNPMRVEQRIGRVHRIGQEHNVNIFNLVIKGSIEDYILEKLYNKLGLFHCAIGEMDSILSKIIPERTFGTAILKAIQNSKNKVDIGKKMEEFFEEVRKGKDAERKLKQLNDKTLEILDLRPIQNA